MKIAGMSVPALTVTQRKYAAILRLVAVSAILFAGHGVPSAAAESDTDEVGQKQRAVIRPTWGADERGSFVIRDGEPSIDEVKKHFESRLKSKVDQIARGCRLNPPQKDKLLLAGRGDIVHLLDRIQDEQKQFEIVTGDDDGQIGNVDVHAVGDPVTELTIAGPFEDGSLFAKTMKRELSMEQLLSLAATDEIKRSGGSIAIRATLAAEVKDVYLTGTAIDDERFARVSRLSDLRFLDLERTRITDKGLSHLPEIRDLEGLRLSDTLVSDAGLKHVSGVPGLKMFWLAGTRVSDAGLVHLKGLTSLRVLVLDGTRVADAGMTHLQRLRDLRWLYLQGTQITDSGVAHLTGLTELQRLQLNDTRVTDLALRHLEALTNLEELWVANTRVSDAGIAALKMTLPRLTIYR
jgi:hypothetical protein